MVLLVVDTLRADHLGCYGYWRPTSPNVDRLASRGVLFEQVVSNCSWTRPSVASLLTGLYPRSTGVYKERFDALAPDLVTLAERFQEAGYATYGATANPTVNSDFGFDQGFDEHLDCGAMWEWMLEDGEHYREVAETVTADQLTDRALTVLDRHSAGPFYLQVLYIDPHTPYAPPEHFDHPLNRRPHDEVTAYDAEIAFADLHLGRLVDRVLASYPDTLVVVTSDHGEGLDSHGGLDGSTTHGYHLYDSTLRVPLIFHHPGLARGTRFLGQVQLVDLAPTILDLLGLELDPDFAGTSLAPVLFGRRAPPLAWHAFSETQFGIVDKVSIREPGMKLVVNHDHAGRTATCDPLPEDVILAEVCAAIEVQGPVELYALPGGENPVVDGLNLAARDTPAGRRLREALDAWEARTPARTPLERGVEWEVESHVLRQLRALGYLAGSEGP